MTNRRKFLASTAAGAGITALAGCTGGGGGNTIKIGAPYMLSGVAESFGASSREGAELAAKEINDEGGIDGQDVEIIFRDHGGSDAARVIRSLVQEDNVDAMIGLTSSGVAVASAPLIEQLQIPMILTDIGTAFVTEPDTDTTAKTPSETIMCSEQTRTPPRTCTGWCKTSPRIWTASRPSRVWVRTTRMGTKSGITFRRCRKATTDWILNT